MRKIYLFFNNKSEAAKKVACLFFTFSLCAASTIAQPPVPIQGVVNTYHQVIEIVPSKACVRVANPSGLQINTMIMLVQMKGATIDLSNSVTFGDVTAINNAGNYEIGTICYIIGDSVFLFHNLLNNYTPSNGKVQLVQFADDLSFDIVNTVTAMPWDSATGLGGVIAIHADLSITLNAPIDASVSGYKGGPFFLSGSTCSNAAPLNGYFYNGSPAPGSTQNGVRKGEGVAFVSSAQSGGRGAPANGGGGGNNHNNSGGGGANLNNGGIGGGNSSSNAVCNVTRRGEAGKALNSSGGQKIFLGGGGGAGHNNNGVLNTGGGNGGGIIFIWTNDLISNNQVIRSNGEAGEGSQADGAGGGGAGGTIILNAANYTGTLSVQANGGLGGNSDDGGNIGRCYGGGGGGSGGVIYFTGSTPSVTASVSPGNAGVESGRDGTCLAVQPASSGVIGNIFPNYIFSRSTSTASYCRFLLPVKLISFNASLIGKKVQLGWQIENPELAKYYLIEKINSNNERTILTTITADDVQRIYTAIDSNPSPGNNLYRLKIIEKDNSITYSEYKQVFINYPPNQFSVYPNPATNKITISGNFSGSVLLRLSDISGKLILQQPLTGTTTTINLPGLSPGVYLLRIGEKTQKLIIH